MRLEQRPAALGSRRIWDGAATRDAAAQIFCIRVSSLACIPGPVRRRALKDRTETPPPPPPPPPPRVSELVSRPSDTLRFAGALAPATSTTASCRGCRRVSFVRELQTCRTCRGERIDPSASPMSPCSTKKEGVNRHLAPLLGSTARTIESRTEANRAGDASLRARVSPTASIRLSPVNAGSAATV